MSIVIAVINLSRKLSFFLQICSFESLPHTIRRSHSKRINIPQHATQSVKGKQMRIIRRMPIVPLVILMQNGAFFHQLE